MQCSPWRLISVANMLCLYIGITFLSLSRHTHPCTIYPCYVGFLVGSMLGSELLVMTGNTTTKTRAFYGQSTSGSIARHALVLRWLVMIHYATTPTCYLLVNLPQIYLLFLSGNLYARSKSSKFFFRSCEKDNLWKNWQWT